MLQLPLRTFSAPQDWDRLSKAGIPVAAATLLTLALAAAAQDAPVTKPSRATGPVVIPLSSHANPEDKGVRAHTNVRFTIPEGIAPSEAPPASGFAYETPASLACLYRVVKPTKACNPNSTTVTPSGGSRRIAIVDAYDDPNAADDLELFSMQFGLPYSASRFHVVHVGGKTPPVDPSGGWELEEALDIEYAHAMAPNATLYLVEAQSNSNTDLFKAVDVASNLVACAKTTTCPKGSSGKGEVTMSWSSDEYSGEKSLDSHFKTPGVVYFASSGDNPGTAYPCVSPDVVCVGGTSIARDDSTGDFLREIAWSEGGGGVSSYEKIPGFQSEITSISKQLSGYRGVPDVAADANLLTGVWIYDSYPYSPCNYYPCSAPSIVLDWGVAGGTSVASPVIAGITNAADHFAASSSAQLSEIYANRTKGYFNDITYGACGVYSGTFAVSGWDQCTGNGSPKNLDK